MEQGSQPNKLSNFMKGLDNQAVKERQERGAINLRKSARFAHCMKLRRISDETFFTNTNTEYSEDQLY
jgi:hypothetical protein